MLEPLEEVAFSCDTCPGRVIIRPTGFGECPEACDCHLLCDEGV